MTLIRCIAIRGYNTYKEEKRIHIQNNHNKKENIQNRLK